MIDQHGFRSRLAALGPRRRRHHALHRYLHGVSGWIVLRPAHLGIGSGCEGVWRSSNWLDVAGHAAGGESRHLGFRGGPGSGWQQRRRPAAEAQEHSGDDADRRRSGVAAGTGDRGGGAAPQVGGRSATAAGDRGRDWGPVVRGEWLGLCAASGRRHVPPSPPSRSALVDRPARRRSLPCDPGQWRYELGDGRRDPAGRRRLAKYPDQPGRSRRPRRGAEPWATGFRRHRIGVDPPGRPVPALYFSQPVCL